MTPIEKLRRIADYTALNNVAEAIREVADELERWTWQPIETAPKDGSAILLGYTPNPRHERHVYEGRWHEDQGTWTSVNGFIVHEACTHWMPLPPAPKGAK